MSVKPARRGRPPHDDVLTPTEWRIVHAVQHGLSNRQIAARRGVSIDAVKYHVANVLAKLALKNRRELKRWAAIPKQSALARRRRTVANSLILGPLGQISRSVKDIKEAEAWYRDVLRLPHLYTFGKLAFFDCGGVRLFLSENEQAATPDSILYFRVEDIRSAHAELAARGVQFVSPPHMIHKHADGTEEWMAFFSDPEGRPLAIMAQAPQS